MSHYPANPAILSRCSCSGRSSKRSTVDRMTGYKALGNRRTLTRGVAIRSILQSCLLPARRWDRCRSRIADLTGSTTPWVSKLSAIEAGRVSREPVGNGSIGREVGTGRGTATMARHPARVNGRHALGSARRRLLRRRDRSLTGRCPTVALRCSVERYGRFPVRETLGTSPRVSI
jgi:hypothetical protein